MDIFDRLKNDHESIRTLLDITAQTTGNSSGRRQLWARLKVLLQAHADAEEQEFYATLRKHEATKEEAEHSIEEHDAIDELIKQLDHIGFDKPDWLNVLGRLDHMVRHHLDEEEEDLFPVAGRVISDTAADRYAAAYKKTRDRLHAKMREDHTTTEEGVDERSFEARYEDTLRSLAAERNIKGRADMNKSELISALRGAPGTDA